MAAVGRGLAQYIQGWEKAEARAGRGMRVGSVLMRKPSRVQLWGCGAEDIVVEGR